MSSDQRGSLEADVNTIVQHSCDSASCLGCSTLHLQSLCYAAQNCAITRCVGTIVNQNKPLCNIGLTLQSLAEQSLSMTLGSWIIFTESYDKLLKVSLEPEGFQRRFDIEWVDDAFYSYVCSAKDVGGQIGAIITSAVGSVLIKQNQKSTNVVDIDGGSRKLDNRNTAELALILNGVNGFLYQLSLLPLYSIIAIQKIYVCNTNSILAIVDDTGITGDFTVRMGRPDLQNASRVVAGECLTAFYEANSDDIASKTSQNSVAEGANEILSNVGSSAAQTVLSSKRGLSTFQRFFGRFSLKTPLHMLDASFTWASGVISGMQDMAQVLDSQNCKVPNYYLYKVTQCACGDEAVEIPAERRNEGLAEGAHWCTGTLKMIDGFGNPTFVYNGFTYEQLKSKLGSMDQYLECLSKQSQDGTFNGNSCPNLEPRILELDSQGVSGISVFQRCKSNYQQKQWDEGAFLMYEPEKFYKYVLAVTDVQHLPSAPGSVGECLRNSEANDESNNGCMLDFTRQAQAYYWRYDRLGVVTDTSDTRSIDGCLVFSGPASNEDPLINEEFRKCSNDYEDTGCKIPHMVWSTGSKNRVPVATLHTVEEIDNNGRYNKALAKFEEARKIAIDALVKLEEFVDSNLEIVLFSGEGDSLHQTMDCVMQGPYAKVDFWASGSERELPVPFWARDAGGLGLTREMDLPCIGEKLNKDFVPPFTCGSETRRSIIKYFVRDFINRGDNNQKNLNSNTLTEELIRERIALLKAAWIDSAKYRCKCEGREEYSLECCVIYKRGGNSTTGREGCELSGEDSEGCDNNFLPPSLDVTFDEIPGEDVVKKIISKVPAYLKQILTEDGNEAFLKYNGGNTDAWNWFANGFDEPAVKEGLYYSHRPIMNYTKQEVGSPFRDLHPIWRTCTGMISQVMFTMPMHPITLDKNTGDWMWTAASVLGLRTPELEFDYTRPTNFDDPTGAEDTSGLSTLEKYVGKLLSASFAESSLFWHYAMRHVPSDSLACARDLGASNVPGVKAPGATIRFQNNDAGIPGLDMGRLPEYDMHGYAAYPIGGIDYECFCGWTLHVVSPTLKECEIPAEICQDIQYARQDCRYELASAEGRTAIASILQQWTNQGNYTSPAHGGKWACPEMDLSDGWGIIPRFLSDQWIFGSQTLLEPDIADLIFSGRAGLRIGNADTLKERAREEGIWPSSRVQALESADGTTNVAIKKCAGVIASTFDTASVAQQVVDDLFPVSQAIHESMPMSVCLRFAIEFAKLQVMEMISQNIRTVTEEIGTQEGVMLVWKKKCESQLSMLGMCRGLSVFELIPYQENIDIVCPFTISDPYFQLDGDGEFLGTYYIAPGCVVYIKDAVNAQSGLKGAFFDPCRHPIANGCTSGTKPAFTLQQLKDSASNTQLPFDPRATGARDVLGTWPIEFTASNATDNVQSNIIARTLEAWHVDGREEVPWRLQNEFITKVVRDGGQSAQGSVGNTRNKWGTSEGFANTGSVEYCDGIADWWPEDWTRPVGYHVTVPCHKDQAGYRTFDSAFAIEREDGEMGLVHMKYQHNLARDPDTYHSEYGGAGLCRRGNYGIPKFQTNTMRVCTQDSIDVQYDATVPVLPKFTSGTQTYGDEYCSDSPYDVPWTIDDKYITNPNMFSVGNLPLHRYDPYDTFTGAKYPTADRLTEVQNTHPGIRDHSWGDSCTDGELLYCNEDADCVPVEAGIETECFRNTCILKRSSSGTCYRHADCADQGKVCAGDGKCVFGTWQVDNEFEEDIDFELYAKSCDYDGEKYETEAYDMQGSSVWQNVPDILEFYGMCGYRDWYEYLEFVEPTDPARANIGACTGEMIQRFGCDADMFDADISRWWETGRPHGEASMRSLWATEKFRVKPHPCDRDYMHIDKLSGCSPVFDDGKSQGGYVSLDSKEKFSYQGRSEHAQTYTMFNDRNQTRRFVNMVGRHPFTDLAAAQPAAWADYKKFGFLSVQSVADGQYRYCSEVEQCRVDPFTYNGAKIASRSVSKSNALSVWLPTYSEACGIFGIVVDNTECPGLPSQHVCCKLDRALLPVYEVLCDPAGTGSTYFDTLDKTCNPEGNADSVFSRITVQETCQQLGTHYAVSSSSETLRDDKIADVRDKLNSLLDAMSPDFNIFNQKQYLQTMDCSQELYRSIQSATQCPTDGASVGNPFCTNYHTTNDFRSGVYYMLSYSTQEVPYAWMHKCMFLHARKFATSGDVIVCNEWLNSEYTKDRLDTNQISYDEETLLKLRRIDGGVNSSMVNERRVAFIDLMARVIRRYTSTGDGDAYDGQLDVDAETIEEIISTPSDFPIDPITRSFLREGISTDYNLMCSTRVIYNTTDEWKTLRERTDRGKVDCRKQVLDWYFKDGAAWDVFEQGTRWASVAGIDKECYHYNNKENWENGYKHPMQFLEDELLAGTFGTPKMHSDVTEHDFLVAQHNSPTDGLLIAEYAPSEIRAFPSIDQSGWGARESQKTGEAYYLDKLQGEIPCINFKEMDKADQLTCDKPNEQFRLQNSSCLSTYERAANIINTFSRQITVPKITSYGGATPIDFLTNPIVTGFECLTGCSGGVRQSEETISAGLSEDVRLELLRQLEALKDECITHAGEGTDALDKDTYCEDPSLPGERATELRREKLDDILNDMHRTDFVRRLCEAPDGDKYYEDGITFGQFAEDSGRRGLFEDLFGVAKKVVPGAEFAETIVEEGGGQDLSRSTAVQCSDVWGSTGNAIIDGVLQRMIWEKIDFVNLQGVESAEVTNGKMLSTIIGPIFGFYEKCGYEEYFGYTCLPPKNRVKRSTHFHPPGRPMQDCFQMGTVVGHFNCGWGYDNGLLGDIKNARALLGQSLKSPASQTPLSWGVNEIRLLKDGESGEQTTDFSSLIYTLYTRMVGKIEKLGKYGGVYLKPRSIDFFENDRTFLEGFDSFNLGSKRDFERKIQDITQNCNTAETIHYGECSDEFLRLYDTAHVNLQQSVLKKGASVVPGRSSMVWPGIRYPQHISDTLPAWSMNKRPERQKFVQWVFNRTGRCLDGEDDNSICMQSPSLLQQVAVNPWLGGDFNPFERCDTLRDITSEGVVGNEKISLSCHPEICPNGATDPYYSLQPNDQCIVRLGNKETQVTETNVPISFATNLCAKKPDIETTCTWPQGQVRQGLTGSEINNLYRDDVLPHHTDTTLAALGKGLFVLGGNPIYYTTKGAEDEIGRAIHSLLKQSPEDVGGHHVVFRTARDSVTGERFMYVDRTPLVSVDEVPVEHNPHPAAYVYEKSTGSSQTHGAFGWRSNLRANMINEDDGDLRALYPAHNNATSNRKWSCPMRRIAFWTRLVSDFNPKVPSPPRSRRMFGNSNVNMNYGTRSHPTQKFRTLERVAEVFTSNGFCFCKDVGDCSVLHTSGSPCSLRETIYSLYDQQYRSATNLDGAATCAQQLDWPFEAGETRDGMPFDSKNAGDQCNVVNRLPAFRYRYRPNGVIRDVSKKTSLDEGGSCHMARPARLDPIITDTQKCRTVEKNHTHIIARCDFGGATGEQNVTMQREMSQAPTWMMQYMKSRRQKCDTCKTDPHTWRVELGTNSMPAGPEVSYGIPFRWSASRLLAADVRKVLCGNNHNNTAECAALLNIPEWSLDNFINNFVDSPEKLFDAQVSPTQSTLDILTNKLSNKPDEDALWDGAGAGWVACSKYNGTCYGTVSKNNWYSEDRGTHCVNAFTEQVRNGNINSTTFGIDICNLNSKLNNLCLTLKTAQTLVFEGNCIFAGACSPQSFIYTPSVYSIINEDFVRGTVTNFYENYNQLREDGSFTVLDNNQLICRNTDEEVDLINRNEAFTSKCSSVQLERLQDGIRIARKVAHLIVESSFIVINMVFSLMRLLVPDGSFIDEVIKEIEFWFTRLIVLVFETLKEVGNMIFRLLFDTGGFGTVIKNIIEVMCWMVNLALEAFNMIVCPIMANVVSPILGFFLDIIGFVVYTFVPHATGVLTKIIELNGNISRMECNYSVNCNLTLHSRPDLPDGANPVATRCWADYIPGLDETDAFSCSAADTCKKSTLLTGQTTGGEDDGRQIVCDACPRQGGLVTNQFGCDTLTKQCTCNRPKRDRTTCTSNDQCYLTGDNPSICKLVNDFSTGASYGSMECQTCPNYPTCHVTDGSGAGTCSCMQLQTPVQSCSPAFLNDRVMPDASQMCLANLDRGARRTTNAFLDWNALVTVPCVLISSASARCFDVGSFGYLVVGTRVSKTTFIGGRRLLGINESGPILEPTPPPPPTERENLISNITDGLMEFSDWGDVLSSDCRALLQEFRAQTSKPLDRSCAGMGITDLIHTENCIHWRRIGKNVIHALNLTSVGPERDYFLVSFEDFAKVFRSKGVFRQLLNTRGILKAILSQLRVLQPLRKVIQTLTEGWAAIHLEKLLDIKNITGAFGKVANSTSAVNKSEFTEMEWDIVQYLKNQQQSVQYLIPFMHHTDAKTIAAFSEENIKIEDKKVIRRDKAWKDNSVAGLTPHTHDPLPTPKIKKVPGTVNINTGRSAFKPKPMNAPPGRKLLQTELLDRDAVSKYSTLTATARGFSDILIANSVADSWLEGPFDWPPKFEYWGVENSCVVADIMSEVALDTFHTLNVYYKEYYNSVPEKISWDFPRNQIKVYNGTPPVNETTRYIINSTRFHSENTDPSRDWVAAFFQFFGDAVLIDMLGIYPQNVQAFFTTGKGVDDEVITAGNVLKGMLVCDMETVILCSERNRNLVISLVFAYLIYLGVATVFGFLNLRGINVFLYALIPVLTMWLAYGISPMCLPMIPTCLLEDVISNFQVAVPAKIIWPNALQVYPKCLGPTWIDEENAIKNNKPKPVAQNNPNFPNVRAGTGDCMLPCTGAPFHFDSWETSLAWIVCGFNPSNCADLSIPYFPKFREAVINHTAVLTLANERDDLDTVNAFSFCFWTTLARVIPIMLGALIAIYLAFGILQFPLILITSGVQFVMQGVAYSHVD